MTQWIGMTVLGLANIITTLIYLFMSFIFFELLHGHFENNIVVTYSSLAGVWLIFDGLKWFTFMRMVKNPKTRWNYYNFIFAVALFIMNIKFPIPFLFIFIIIYFVAGVIGENKSQETKHS